MPTKEARRFEGLDEVRDLLEDLGAEDLVITGSMIKMGPHPENRRRMILNEPLEMDLDEAYSVLRSAPSTNYKVSFYHGEEPEIGVKARVGFLPSVTIKGVYDGFEEGEDYEEFLENNEYWS